MTRHAACTDISRVLALSLAAVVLSLLMTTRSVSAQSNTHIVQPGESLTSIAAAYGTNVSTLLRLNNLSDPNVIRVGQAIVVPGGPAGSGAGRSATATPATTAEPPSLPPDQQTRVYLVKPGDTLATIAARFETTTAFLAELNQLSPAARLNIGEPLRVPVSAGVRFEPQQGDDIPVAGKYYVHTVQQGETLAAIAASYGTSLRRLIELNNIKDPAQIGSGTRLVVPPPSFAELFAGTKPDSEGVPHYPAIPTEGKWISVNLTYQRTYAWEGNKLIKRFAISSGKAKTPTVTGVFRIWAKVASQTMQGGSRAAGDYYNLPNVQWVQYFYRDYSFHGTYWHNNFGVPMSHGCVNMTNADAKWLFDWASPTVNDYSWHITDAADPGTLVIVHY